MEKVPMNMERDRRINWKVCLAVAKGHLKADFTEKALTILKHSEQLSRVMREDMPKRIYSLCMLMLVISMNYIVFGVSLRILQVSIIQAIYILQAH
jgi:putative Mn2+ efflux pump MntP